MKMHRNLRYVSFLLVPLLVVMMAVPTKVAAAQLPVNLGTTSSYAVLAGSAITNTGPTTINGDAGGDVGLYPGSSFTGKTDVTMSGTAHVNDAAASKAKDDLVIAFNDAAGRLPVTRIPTELGGKTLTPGVYDSADGTFQITGTLTLNAQGDPDGVFIFLAASTLITASNSNVTLVNSARYCRIFWKVGSSATLGTDSHLVGHVFAQISITANTRASVQGQLLARTGAVTLDTNTITNGLCATVTASSIGNTGETGVTASSIGNTGETGVTASSIGDTGETGVTASSIGDTGETGDIAIIGLILLGLAGSLMIVQRRKRTH